MVVRAFMVGTVVGGVAVLVWGDRARAYLEGRIRLVSDRIIHVLDTTTDTLDAWRSELERLGGRRGVLDAERRPVARERRDMAGATGAAVK